MPYLYPHHRRFSHTGVPSLLKINSIMALFKSLYAPGIMRISCPGMRSESIDISR